MFKISNRFEPLAGILPSAKYRTSAFGGEFPGGKRGEDPDISGIKKRSQRDHFLIRRRRDLNLYPTPKIC